MGFAGHLTHPARQNLRPVKVEMNGSEWFLQYSPYGYYNEHCIVFNKNHVPMVIDDSVFDKLFDFIEQFPHYMLGSNADLPIVGGSILTHEHFQGGRYTFPMARASVEKPFLLSNHSDVSAGIVKWPMSVIRLSSYNRASLSAACAEVLKKWRAYTDEQAGIFAQTDGVPHNTITPIARMNLRGPPARYFPPGSRAPPHQEGKHRTYRGNGSGGASRKTCDRAFHTQGRYALRRGYRG